MTRPAFNSRPNVPFLFQASAVAAISFVVHLNALSAGFFYDDINLVLKNTWIRHFGHIPDVFTSNLWGFMASDSDFYRPMLHVLYMLCYQVFGLDPWGYHLVNVMLHCGVSVLVFMTARKLFERPDTAPSALPVSPAFLAAVLFAVHPAHSDAVTWAAGAQELLCAFFFMLSFYLYIRAAEKGPHHTLFLLLSAASFLFGALSKETALSLPLALLAYDFCFPAGGRRMRDFITRYSPYLAASVLYLALRHNALGGDILPEEVVKLTAYEHVLNVPVLFARYLGKLILPLNISLLHAVEHMDTVRDPVVIASFVAAAAFAALAYIERRRDKTAFTGLMLLVIPLLPALYIPAIALNKFAAQSLHLPFANRYLYLPSIGFVLFLASLAARVSARGRMAAAWAVLACFAVSAVYSAGTAERTSEWRDELAFWSNEVETSPDLDVPHVNLGIAYGVRGRLKEAAGQFREALEINPGNAFAHNNIGIIYSQEGLTDEAIEEFKSAVELKPNYAGAYYNLGLAFEDKGLLDDAIHCLDTAARLVPSDKGIRNALNEAYMLKEGS